MNKSIKKLFLFLGILVVVTVIITGIYLLMTSKPYNGNEGTPSPSASAAPSDSPSPSPSVSPSPSPSPTDVGSYTREETVDGTIYHVTVPGALASYSVTVNETIFDFTNADGPGLFKSKTNENEFLEITFIEDAKATLLAPSFLDAYIDYTEFEQSGENHINGTKIPGETVAGNDGQIQVEAWLVNTKKGVLAVIISYNLPNKEKELAELNKVLATLSLDQ